MQMKSIVSPRFFAHAFFFFFLILRMSHVTLKISLDSQYVLSMKTVCFPINYVLTIVLFFLKFIRCFYSVCPHKVSPSVNLRLQAVCVYGCGISNLFYQWQFFTKNETEWSLLEFPSELKVETDKNDFTVPSYILENILGQGGEGLAQVEAWREGSKKGFTNKTITVNEPPIPGNCSCIPSLGEGYKTNFQVICDGWVDPDKPLRYSFSYGEGDNSRPVLTSEKPSSSKPFKIYKQPTNGDTSIPVKITISVEDSLGMKSAMSIFAKVRLCNL